jgi:ABC-2 type transport system permease protein
MPVAQLTFLPLSFISGIFYPLDGAPGWLLAVAKAFPLYHIVQGFDRCFVPQVAGGAWSGNDLLVIAIWTVAGLFVAVRRFRVSPVEGETGRVGRIRRARRAEVVA